MYENTEINKVKYAFLNYLGFFKVKFRWSDAIQ